MLVHGAIDNYVPPNSPFVQSPISLYSSRLDRLILPRLRIGLRCLGRTPEPGTHSQGYRRAFNQRVALIVFNPAYKYKVLPSKMCVEPLSDMLVRTMHAVI